MKKKDKVFSKHVESSLIIWAEFLGQHHHLPRLLLQQHIVKTKTQNFWSSLILSMLVSGLSHVRRLLEI